MLPAQSNTLLKETGLLLNIFGRDCLHTTILLLLFLLRHSMHQPANDTQADEREKDACISHTSMEYPAMLWKLRVQQRTRQVKIPALEELEKNKQN